MKRSNASELCSKPKLNSKDDLIDAIIEMLYATLEVLGQSMSADAIALIATDLAVLPFETVASALRKLRYSNDRLTLNAILRHACIPVGEQHYAAEAALAWEQACDFGERYTEIDIQSENYIPGRSSRAQEKYSALSERIKATVRRIGGWSLFRKTPAEEMHWLQKRFFEHYELYEPMEYLAHGHPALSELEGAVHQLAALKSISGISSQGREEN